jgi:ubiquinone/menaquinone biosynthesis C-methylase UbiE
MSRTGDWLGGISLDTIPDNIFETYERSMVPAVFRPWAERLVGIADLRPGERVLDLACATGIVARVAAPRVGESGSVTGLDLLAGMLEVARAASRDFRPAIDWVEGNALEMPLPDASFDLVLCQQGLQFFPDKVAALEEVRRVLVPTGRVLVSVWGPIERSPAVAALQRALERHAPEVAGFLPVVFALSDTEELGGYLTKAGFNDVSVRPQVAEVRFPSVEEYLNTYLGSTPLGGIISSMPKERRAALGADVAEALRNSVDELGLTFPQETNVAFAQA